MCRVAGGSGIFGDRVMRRLIAGTLIFLTSMVVAYADTITIKGKQYSNVLVYESGSYYYVKLPREGKSLSVRKSDVPRYKVFPSTAAFIHLGIQYPERTKHCNPDPAPQTRS